MPARSRLLVCALAVSLALAGCGGSSAGDGDADPAAYVPSDASVYLEAVVRPEGSQREELTELAGRILRTDEPVERIHELIDGALAEGDGEVTYEKDIAPWLGRRAGIYLTGFEGDEPRFVVVLAARDAEAARATLERTAEKPVRERSHDGVDYIVQEDGESGGVVDDAVVVASSERELRRAIEAAHGKPLAESERYGAALEGLPGDRVATMFVDLRRFFDAAIASEDLGGLEASVVRGVLGSFLVPFGAAGVADSDEIAIETSTLAQGGSPAAALSTLGLVCSTPLTEDVPGDAWLATGIPKAGETAKGIVGAFGGAFGGPLIQGRLEQETGLDLERDVYGWIGDVALFARGDSVAALDGAVVVEVTDRERARQAIPKIAGALVQQAGLLMTPVRVAGARLAFEAPTGIGPKRAVAALAGDRFVVAAGRDALAAALDPDERFGDSGAFDTARDLSDGLDPSLVIDAPALVELIAAAAGGDPDFARARPYLDLISVLAAASGKDGDRIRSRFAVRLR